ncbi:Phosphate acetyltransferase [Limihaloglobus sulfuriphilus]|uniref:Phosphate acetyltransferase n=1 Tax=Limihaloglobus sulfuriphilus TaxID=1851148 RepID=A0A1Q2MC40_9BACT|nr:phosphate acetyltransferase [Limihaloglobus sulfuriphilus]AQQ70295.1 Phosphate acetyltransferase [Limihaloglobus sulfuriphilus]
METNEKFRQMILARAKDLQKHIVLPEGDDPRTIAAAAEVSKAGMADLTILGYSKSIREQLESKGADMSRINIVCPSDSPGLKDYAEAFYELRKHKGLTLEKAFDMIKEVSYFATMMVKMDHADGLVSGAVHSSADTIRPALQIIKAAKGVKTVSSMFFMCRGEETLLFADSGLNQEPDADQIADITLSTAYTAKQFGIIPKIAVVGYSTKGSGVGPLADKVRAAAKAAIAKMESDFDGEYYIDGELQFDAAYVPEVAAKKAPESPLKGRANTFIFPDLNTGNTCYKMAERLAGMSAYGPILQGIAKPVNDLSRGCSSDDIVATIAITAIQSV